MVLLLGRRGRVSTPRSMPPEGANARANAASVGKAPIHLVVPRAKVPLSLWDWRVWSQARPTLWRYGDAGNLYPARDTDLKTDEWMATLLLREEMEYSLPTDTEPFKVRRSEDEPERTQNSLSVIT